MVTAPGIIIVPSRNMNRTPRPGNWNLAKPYPPSAQKNRASTVLVVAMNRVFQKARSAPACSKMNRYPSRLMLGEIRIGGWAKISSCGLKEVLSIQTKGRIMKIEMAIRGMWMAASTSRFFRRSLPVMGGDPLSGAAAGNGAGASRHHGRRT